MHAYSHYSRNAYSHSIFSLERHIHTYPADENIPYAHYLIEICYYEQILDEKKDLKPLLKAKEKFILSITENGYGKRTDHNYYRVTNIGGKGIIGIVNSSRNGNVSSSFPVNEGDEILISTR